MGGILEAFLAGKEARRVADAQEQINAMQQFVGQNGAAIMGGDQNALAQLAGFGPQGLQMAMGVQGDMEARADRAYNRERVAKADARGDQEWEMKLAEYKKGLTAEQAAAEAAALENAAKIALTAQTPEDWDRLATENGAPELVGQFDQREAVAARFMSIADVLKAQEAPAPADEYQRYFQEETAAGRQPLDRIGFEQAKKGKGFSVTTADGTTVEYGGATGTAMGQNPDATATPRDPDRMARNLSDADSAEITRNRELAAAAGDLESIANQMEVLAPRIGYTGPGGRLYGAIDDALGVLPGDSGARGAFRSLSTDAQLTFTAKTKGAITEAEMALFASAVPGLTQTKGGNKAIAQVLRAGAQRVQARSQFMEEYAAKKGSLEGAQAAWQNFMNANPIISEGEAGNLVVQGEGDWRPYLEGDLTPADPKDGPGSTMTGSIPPEAVDMLKQNDTPEQRKYFDEVFGPGAAAQALGGN